MYEALIWKDHVTTPNGEVLQKGTNFSATNFNRMEVGITDAHLANKLLVLAVRELSERLSAAESKIAALTNE